MKKRICYILLTLCMVVLLPCVVLADGEVAILTIDADGKLLCDSTAVNITSVTVDVGEDAASPGDFFNQSVEGYVLTNGAYKLGSDVTVGAPIIIDGGTADAPITLDLCGHVLKYENSASSGSVIVVNSDAYFTLTDSASHTENGYSYTAGPDAGDFTLYTPDMEESGTTAITGGIITGGTGTAVDLGGYYEYDGGGVFVGCKATFTMTGGSIVGCKVDRSIAYGGGVFVAGGRSGEDPMDTIFNMTGGSIIGCKAKSGGGVYVSRNSEFNMTDSRIIGCTATDNGGGIYTSVSFSGGVYMKNSTVSQCAVGNDGGGVANNCNFVMENSSITGCIAMKGGGVITESEISREMFIMKSGSTISGCVATADYDSSWGAGSGGGMYIGRGDVGHVIIEEGSAISDCTAKPNCGESIYIAGYGQFDAKGGSVQGVAIIGKTIKNSSMTGSALFYDGIEKGKQSLGYIIGKLVTFMDGGTMYAQTLAGTTQNQDVYTCGGGKITLPTLTKDDYRFTGWYKDSACTEKWDPNKTDGENDASFNVTGKLNSDYGTYTLYAGWAPITYAVTITFDATEGTVDTKTMATDENGKLPTLPTPIRQDYNFLGWFTENGEMITTDTVFVVDTTVYAQWQIKSSSPQSSSFLPTWQGWELIDKIVAANKKKDEPVEVEPEPEETEPVAEPWNNPFSDVTESDAFYDAIKFVYENGYMNGMSNDTFAPDEGLTRGMLVTVLYRAAGSPVMDEANPFVDVAEDAWYHNAVVWAKSIGLINGITENEFAPESLLTREQLVTIFFRYAEFLGYDLSIGEDTNILSCEDFADIAEYAIPAMQWACGAGLIENIDGNILPKDNATRALVAMVLLDFYA